MCAINAGQLTQRVTLLTPAAPVLDGQGGHLPGGGPDTETPVWARVKVLTGRQTLALGLVATQQVHEITLRATGPLVPQAGQRLRWGAATLMIQSVAPSEQRDLWALTCFDDGRN